MSKKLNKWAAEQAKLGKEANRKGSLSICTELSLVSFWKKNVCITNQTIIVFL